MPEGGHDGGNGEGVGDLVDSSKKGANVCQTLWCWEGEDGVSEVIGWFDASVCDQKSQEVYRSFSKLELFRVESTPTPGSLFEEITHSVEILFNGVIIDEAVINTILDILKVSHDLCLPVCVAVPSTDQALWGSPVTITAPGGYKCRQGTVSWV